MKERGITPEKNADCAVAELAKKKIAEEGHSEVRNCADFGVATVGLYPLAKGIADLDDALNSIVPVQNEQK